LQLGVDPGNADARAKFEALVETRDAIAHANEMLDHGDHDSVVFYLGKAIDVRAFSLSPPIPHPSSRFSPCLA
jgi:hypothetical protein